MRTRMCPTPTTFTVIERLMDPPPMTTVAQLESVLTCPECGHARRELMPTDACQFFYECERCKTVLRPKAGDCCVFCSYGSVKCPPVTARQGCACGNASR
jgi:hypothetical protein